MKLWLYKWLPRIFGCHQNPERSFFIKGKQFPICARCTGEFIGILLTPVIYAFIKRFPLWTYFLMLVPLIIDGTVQAITRYKSNNMKRLVTGLIFGVGFMMLFMLSTKYCFVFGLDYGRNLIK